MQCFIDSNSTNNQNRFQMMHLCRQTEGVCLISASDRIGLTSVCRWR